MRGTNVITLSKEEMKAAMLHYFKTVLLTEKALEGTTVADVDPVKGGYDGGTDAFDITLRGEEAKD